MQFTASVLNLRIENHKRIFRIFTLLSDFNFLSFGANNVRVGHAGWRMDHLQFRFQAVRISSDYGPIQILTTRLYSRFRSNFDLFSIKIDHFRSLFWLNWIIIDHISIKKLKKITLKMSNRSKKSIFNQKVEFNW